MQRDLMYQLSFFSNYHQISQSTFLCRGVVCCIHFILSHGFIELRVFVSFPSCSQWMFYAGADGSSQPHPVLCTPLCCIILICFILNIKTKQFLSGTLAPLTLKFVQYNSAFCFGFLGTLSHRSTDKNFIWDAKFGLPMARPRCANVTWNFEDSLLQVLYCITELTENIISLAGHNMKCS